MTHNAAILVPIIAALLSAFSVLSSTLYHETAEHIHPKAYHLTSSQPKTFTTGRPIRIVFPNGGIFQDVDGICVSILNNGDITVIGACVGTNKRGGSYLFAMKCTLKADDDRFRDYDRIHVDDCTDIDARVIYLCRLLESWIE